MLRRAVWAGIAVLSVIGVVSGGARAIFVADLATLAEPARLSTLSVFRDNPIPHTDADLAHFDGRFAAQPIVTLLHVVPGALFLALAPLQFSSRVRTDYLNIHRWSGRALMLLGVTSVLSSFYFGLLNPFGGLGEAAAIGLFGALFLFALARAYLAIRSGHVDLHREWVIRAFAVALAISTVRLVNVVLDITFMPSGTALADLFVLSLWIGWVTTIAAAEAWIRYTRTAWIRPSAF